MVPPSGVRGGVGKGKGGVEVKTLTIELRWPFPVLVIDGAVVPRSDRAVWYFDGRKAERESLMLDPPPLLVAACAAKARAESSRRGWQTRKKLQAASFECWEKEQSALARGDDGRCELCGGIGYYRINGLCPKCYDTRSRRR